ncbi:hypothetical protein F4810DRAFT_648727, partial [Camillea tinctor]
MYCFIFPISHSPLIITCLFYLVHGSMSHVPGTANRFDFLFFFFFFLSSALPLIYTL